MVASGAIMKGPAADLVSTELISPTSLCWFLSFLFPKLTPALPDCQIPLLYPEKDGSAQKSTCPTPTQQQPTNDSGCGVEILQFFHPGLGQI